MSAPIAIRPKHQNLSAHARVVVCLSGNVAHDRVLLQRAVGEISAGASRVWLVHVEFPPVFFRYRANSVGLQEEIAVWAARIGAEHVWLRSSDVVSALIDFARASNASRVIVHRGRCLFRNRWLRRSVAQRLIDKGAPFQIEIVGVGAPTGPLTARRSAKIIQFEAPSPLRVANLH